MQVKCYWKIDTILNTFYYYSLVKNMKVQQA